MTIHVLAKYIKTAVELNIYLIINIKFVFIIIIYKL